MREYCGVCDRVGCEGHDEPDEPIVQRQCVGCGRVFHANDLNVSDRCTSCEGAYRELVRMRSLLQNDPMHKVMEYLYERISDLS